MTKFILPVLLLLCSSCHGPLADEEHFVQSVKVVEKLVPVPTPCEASMDKFSHKNVPEPGASPEVKLFWLAGAFADAEKYINELSAVAVSCGVQIK